MAAGHRGGASAPGLVLMPKRSNSKDHPAVELSPAHLEAIERHRRIIVHFDVIMGDGANFPTKDIDDLIEFKFGYADDPEI